MRMPRLQVYLPDDLYDQLKARGLPASELLQTAVRAELERPVLVLDSGGFSYLAARSTATAALIRSLRREDLWPPVIPTMVLVESLQGRPGRDEPLNQFIATCLLQDSVPLTLAR